MKNFQIENPKFNQQTNCYLLLKYISCPADWNERECNYDFFNEFYNAFIIIINLK
jgi:hypothetical protein